MIDFNDRPFIVIWEMTRACALKCVHCRANAIETRDPNELTTNQAFRLLDEIAAFGNPVLVLTGGDPMRRPDVGDIVEYGSRLGLRVAMTPSGTGEVTLEALKDLKARGLVRLAVSLDGSSAELHDAFRQVKGSYDWTLQIMRWANEINLPLQINTTVSRGSLEDLETLWKLIGRFEISLWSLFFLVPVGRARLEDEPGGRDYERVFGQMGTFSKQSPFQIKSTEAPHYRRFVLQHEGAPTVSVGRKSNISGTANSFGAGCASEPGRAQTTSAAGPSAIGRAPQGVNDGKGFVFVSHTGEIYPSGFLPIPAGNAKRDSLAQVYRAAPLFKRIRDASQLKGKCGVCEFRMICGGSRARAYAVSGDYMAPDPFCVYIPKGYSMTEEEKRFW